MLLNSPRLLKAGLAALLANAVALACGSADSHRAVVGEGGAGSGAGGEGTAGQRTPDSGGGSSTTPPLGGAAGELSGGGGAPQAGAAGAGPVEISAGQAGTAAGEGGAGGQGSAVSCVSDSGLTVLVPGWRADVFSSGALFVQPNAMVFGNDGKLYVANSHSLIAGASDQGEVLVVDASGAAAVFATDDSMRGPDGVAFGTPVSADALGPLLVAVEDQVEAGLRTTDEILSIDAGAVTSFVDADEPTNLLRGPGGAFGTDLYYTARTNLTGGPPNELRLFHRNDAADGGVFKLTSALDGTTEIVGANVFTWGTGGALGTDLYLATAADLPYSPGSTNSVFRVQPSGSATLLASYRSAGLAASPAAGGAYGDYLYSAGASSLDRIDSAGTVTSLLDGLSQPNGIVFGPDGALYVADTGAQRILKVVTCTP